MKLFVCITSDEHGLLPHFLKHYADHGIKQFYVAADTKMLAQLRRQPYDIVCDDSQDVQDSITGGALAVSAMRQRYQAPDEWVMVVDLDEFVDFEAPLSTVVSEMEAEGANVGRAIMYDRFTRSGDLVRLAPGDSLPEVFPVKARFNRNVMKGTEYKGVFVKGHLPSEHAHHDYVGQVLFSRDMTLSHYRFCGPSLTRFRNSYNLVRSQGVWWASQYANILDHYEQYNRFAWEYFGGWRTDLLMTDCGVDGKVVSVLHRDSTPDRAVLAQCFSRRDYDLPGCILFKVADAYQAIVDTGKMPLIIDAGANIGASALWFANKWPHARIAAIEPDRDNFEILASNINRQNLNCELYQAGLDVDDQGAVLTDPGSGAWGYRTSRDGEGTLIRTVTTAGIVEASRKNCVPFIMKIDIEGYEQTVFADDTRAIDAFPLVIIELHDWMLPGQGSSLPFMRWHARNNREIVFQGENVFSVDHERLGALLRR